MIVLMSEPIASSATTVATTGTTNPIYAKWLRLSRLPGGRWLFSRAIGRMAPYTGTIKAQVLELEPGFARVAMNDRPAIRNHLRSVHAIALSNLGELVTGLAVSSTMPADARGIPVRLSIDFVKKARGRLVAECRCPAIDSAEPHEYEVVGIIRDPEGDEVATLTARWKVGPKG